MKKIITILVFSSLLCLPISADIFKAGGEIFKSTKTYAETGIGFELVNKSATPIWIAIRNGLNLPQIPDLVKTGEMVRYKIDINQDTKLYVWFKDPGLTEKKKPTGWFEKLITSAATGAATFVADKEYSFPKGKTIYLTWDKEKFPRAQTGPLGGILNKTDSGLSLKNNVSKDQIKQK